MLKIKGLVRSLCVDKIGRVGWDRVGWDRVGCDRVEQNRTPWE